MKLWVKILLAVLVISTGTAFFWFSEVRAWEAGCTLEQTWQVAEVTEDDGCGEISLIIRLGRDGDFVLGRAWEEATGNFTLRGEH